jgi:hypothetical protein
MEYIILIDNKLIDIIYVEEDPYNEKDHRSYIKYKDKSLVHVDKEAVSLFDDIKKKIKFIEVNEDNTVILLKLKEDLTIGIYVNKDKHEIYIIKQCS